MRRLAASIILAGLALAHPVAAADLRERVRPEGGFEAGFLATCEDLGRFCFAKSCGRDQIEAAEGCRARCPGAVVLGAEPAACPVPDGRAAIVLRRRG